MKKKITSFYYFVQDLSEYFESFNERLMSRLALNGTAIQNQETQPDFQRLNVAYMEEKGILVIVPVKKDIKVVYEVSGGGIGKKGLKDAIIGGALGGALGTVASGLLNRDKSTITDALTGAALGSAAGGAYGIIDGFGEATENATQFSILLAECIRTAEDELREIKIGKEEAVRARREEVEGEVSELRDEYDNMFSEVTALGDEIDILSEEGKNITKAKMRYDKAKKSLEEAEPLIEARKKSEIRAKLKSSERMIEMAREEIDKLQEE